MNPVRQFLVKNVVVIMFTILIIIAIPFSKLTGRLLLQEILTSLGHNSLLVIALLFPVMAGMGLFRMVLCVGLGVIAAQIGIIYVVENWEVYGILQIMLISVPISILLGFVIGKVMNMFRVYEITSFITVFFIVTGIYMWFAEYTLKSSRSLYGFMNIWSYDSIFQRNFAGLSFPVLNYIIVAAVCAFIIWFKKTRLGGDMLAAGEDQEAAANAGINVDRTHIIAMIISTVLACIGHIYFLQRYGILLPVHSHSQAIKFSITALIIGGATLTKASITNALIGVVLFSLFLVLFGANMNHNIVSSGVLLYVLAMYETVKQYGEYG